MVDCELVKVGNVSVDVSGSSVDSPAALFSLFLIGDSFFVAENQF